MILIVYFKILWLYLLSTELVVILNSFTFQLSSITLRNRRNFQYNLQLSLNEIDGVRALKQVYSRKVNLTSINETIEEQKEGRELAFFYLRDVLKIRDKTLSKIVAAYPFILYCRPDTNLRPTIEAFKSFGFKSYDIRKLIEACPTILGLNAAWTIPEKLITIQKLYSLNRQGLVNTVTREPFLLTSSIDRNIAVASIFTDVMCMSPNEIRTMVNAYPRVAMLNVNDLKDCWNLLINKFGFTEDTAKSLVVKNPYIMSKAFLKYIDDRVKFFNDELGLLPPFSELQKLIIGSPSLLVFSVDYFLRPNVKLLKKYLGLNTKLLVKVLLYQPNILCYNPLTLERNLNQVLFLLTGLKEYQSYNNQTDPKLIFDKIEHVFSDNSTDDINDIDYLYDPNIDNKDLFLSGSDMNLLESIELNEENDIYSMPSVTTFHLSNDQSSDIYDDLAALRKDAEAFDEYERNSATNTNTPLNISEYSIPPSDMEAIKQFPIDISSSISSSFIMDEDNDNEVNTDELSAWGKASPPNVILSKSSILSLDLLSDISQAYFSNGSIDTEYIGDFTTTQAIPNKLTSHFTFPETAPIRKVHEYDKAVIDSVKCILLSCTCLFLTDEVAKKAIRIFTPLLSYRIQRSQQMIWALALTLGMNRKEISKVVAMYPRSLSSSVEVRLNRLVRSLGCFALYYLNFKRQQQRLQQDIVNCLDDEDDDNNDVNDDSDDTSDVEIESTNIGHDDEYNSIVADDNEWMEFLKKSYSNDTVCNNNNITNIEVEIDVEQALINRRNNVIRKMIRSVVNKYPLIIGTNIERIERRLEVAYTNKELMNVLKWDKVVMLIRRPEDKHEKYVNDILYGKKKVVQLEETEAQKKKRMKLDSRNSINMLQTSSVILDDGGSFNDLSEIKTSIYTSKPLKVKESKLNQKSTRVTTTTATTTNDSDIDSKSLAAKVKVKKSTIFQKMKSLDSTGGSISKEMSFQDDQLPIVGLSKQPTITSDSTKVTEVSDKKKRSIFSLPTTNILPSKAPIVESS